MYGWLSCDESLQPGEIEVWIPEWEPLGALKLTSGERAERTHQVAAFADYALAQEPAAVRERMLASLREIVVLCDESCLGFAMNMCVAHERLPEALRAERLAAINAVVDSYFSDVAAPGARLSQLLGDTRKVAILIPDALMDTRVRSICTRIRNDIMCSPDTTPPEHMPVVRYLVQMHEQLIADHIPCLEIVCQQLTTLVLSRPTARFESIRDQIIRLTKLGLSEVVMETRDRLAAHADLPIMLRMDALERVVTDVLGQGRPARWSDVIEPHVAMALALNDAQYNLCLRASVQAVRAGVPMGSQQTLMSQAALASVENSLQAVDLAMTPGRLREARQGRASDARPGPSKPGAIDAVDVDAVRSWSVDQLVRWIEGPVTDAGVKQPIDRRRIVARDQEARRKAPAPRGPAVPAAALTEADVGGMIEDALSATARFFLDDINELLPMAAALGASEQAKAGCADLRKALTTLADRPSSLREATARNLLQATETAIASLRASVKQARATALVEGRFALELGAALHAEALAMGKRHGGVIQCAVCPTDWSFVAMNFHQRWLPRVTSIAVDDLPFPLDSDQAVALYVTASSLSQYAFDVSVHLWRRRPGRSSLPSHGGGMYPPMNTTDWFDTYIPCAVLHVPLAQ